MDKSNWTYMHFYCIFKCFFYFSAQSSSVSLSYLVESNFIYPPFCFSHIHMVLGKHVRIYTQADSYTYTNAEFYCFIVYFTQKDYSVSTFLYFSSFNKQHITEIALN